MPKRYLTRHNPDKSLLTLLLEHVAVQPNGCWWWTGPLNDHGYGRARIDGHHEYIHCVIYSLMVGPVPGDFNLTILAIRLITAKAETGAFIEGVAIPCTSKLLPNLLTFSEGYIIMNRQ